jgi:hypothetical protein
LNKGDKRWRREICEKIWMGLWEKVGEEKGKLMENANDFLCLLWSKSSGY